MSLDALYTSAPILDYEETTDPDTASADADVRDAPGVMTLAPESFDAAVLDLLLHP